MLLILNLDDWLYISIFLLLKYWKIEKLILSNLNFNKYLNIFYNVKADIILKLKLLSHL